MACACYEIKLQECLSAIIIDGGLTPNTTYYLFVRDKHQNQHFIEALSDDDGVIGFLADDLPAGLLMSFSGIQIKIYTELVTEPYCPPTPSGDSVQFTFCGLTYDCIDVTFIANDGDTTQTIPNCDEVQPEQGDILTFPAANDSLFCPQVKACIGIKPSTGNAGNFLNEQGNFIEIPGSDLTDYYTKEEADVLLNGKSNTGHTHTIDQVTDLQEALDGKASETDLAAHVSDNNNPHSVTLEQVRAQDGLLEGDIDAGGNSILNLRNPTSNQDASTKNYTDAAEATAKAYADSLVTQAFRVAGDWDASVGTYPTAGTGTGSGGAIRRGDLYNITVAGTMGGYAYDVGDKVYAIQAIPGQVAANWGDMEHNTQQATESIRGTAMVIDATTAADENTLNDQKYVTGKKLWANFWQRVLALAWTWAAKQTFTLAPRFSSVGASQVLTVDGSKDLTSEAKGTAFNKDFGTGTSNVPEIGVTLGNSLPVQTTAAGKLQTVTVAAFKSLLALVKADVGLGNVPNTDATVAANITQDSTHRFITDTERSLWNKLKQLWAYDFTAHSFTGSASATQLGSSIALPLNITGGQLQVEARIKTTNYAGGGTNAFRFWVSSNPASPTSGVQVAMANTTSATCTGFERSFTCAANLLKAVSPSTSLATDKTTLQTVTPLTIDWTVQQYFGVTVVGAATNVNELEYIKIYFEGV